MIKFWQWTGLPERNGLIKSGEVGITMSLFPAPPNSQDISIKILILCWDYIQFFHQNWMKSESFAICLKVSPPPPPIYLQPKLFSYSMNIKWPLTNRYINAHSRQIVSVSTSWICSLLTPRFCRKATHQQSFLGSFWRQLKSNHLLFRTLLAVAPHSSWAWTRLTLTLIMQLLELKVLVTRHWVGSC